MTNAERQRRYRERRRNAVTGEDVTPVTVRLRPALNKIAAHGECKRQIGILEAEVAALKERLARAAKGGGDVVLGGQRVGSEQHGVDQHDDDGGQHERLANVRGAGQQAEARPNPEEGKGGRVARSHVALAVPRAVTWRKCIHEGTYGQCRKVGCRPQLSRKLTADELRIVRSLFPANRGEIPLPGWVKEFERRVLDAKPPMPKSMRLRMVTHA